MDEWVNSGKKKQPVRVTYRLFSIKWLLGLEAPAVELDTRIGDGDKPDVFVAGAHIGNVDAQGFQTILQLLDAKILIAGHEIAPFSVRWF